MKPTNADLVSRYLEYLEKVRQNDSKSVDLRRVHLRRLLIWAGDTPFARANEIEPLFPVYLATSETEQRHKPLSPRFIQDVCVTARTFFTRLKKIDPDQFKSIEVDWIEMLRPGIANAVQTELEEHQVYTLGEVRRLLAMPANNLLEQRAQGAVAMLYLSGMRDGALMTLPVSCVDLEKLQVHQLPSKGVATKFHKAAVTSLLNIPDLLDVVREWDNKVRDRVGKDGYWYALVEHNGKSLCKDRGEGNPVDRRRNFARLLRVLCERAGIPYRRPHCLRHGHAVYGIKHARTMEELKAVSQNLMHSNMSITDGLYGRLTSEDINRMITNLGCSPVQPAGDIPMLLQAMIKLQSNPGLLQQVLTLGSD